MTPRECSEWIKRGRLLFAPLAKLFSDRKPSDRSLLADEWCSTLTAVDRDTAHTILDRMHSGEIEAPRYDWSLLPGIVRREAIKYAASNVRDEQRHKCATCRGMSLVELINPKFVERWPTVAKAKEEFGEQWEGAAIAWWRVERNKLHEQGVNRGPLFVSAICNCDAAEPKRTRLHNYNSALSSGHKWDGSLPAVCIVYDPQVHTTREQYFDGRMSAAQELETERDTNALAGYEYPGSE